MMDLTTKKSLVQALKQQIATRDNQAVKALITIFNNQTASEQATDSVRCFNGIGFTGHDAPFMSSLAKQYIDKGFLSEKQLYYVKKTMPKYAGQLIEQSLSSGKITKNGSKYTWKKDTISYKHQDGNTYQMSNIPSTDPENDWEDEWPSK